MPASTTASRNASNEPREAIWAATTAVNPAAGPLTLVCEPLTMPTTIPPTMPATRPENNGALDARATPRHSGRATKNTTTPAIRSRITVVANDSEGGEAVMVRFSVK